MGTDPPRKREIFGVVHPIEKHCGNFSAVYAKTAKPIKMSFMHLDSFF